jgi:hypothetical protein
MLHYESLAVLARQIAIFASCGVGDLPLRRFTSTAGCRSPASLTHVNASVEQHPREVVAGLCLAYKGASTAQADAGAAADTAGAAPGAFDLFLLLQPTNTRASFGLAQPVRDSSLVSLDHVLDVQGIQGGADPTWGPVSL